MKSDLLTRQPDQEKKQYYRRLAHRKKSEWAAVHRLQNDPCYRSHFVRQEEDTSTDDLKTKRIVKGEMRSEQKLRNRVAAQESRERHRAYLAELERKAHLYDQLVQRQGLVCKHCQQKLQLESLDCESPVSFAVSGETLAKESGVECYLDEQMVRIDNQGATTPYGIFFLVCLIAVLALLLPSQDAAPARLLANYQSTISQLIDLQEELPAHKNIPMPKFLQIAKMKGEHEAQSCPHEQRGHLRAQAGQGKVWRKIGEYTCFEPQPVIRREESGRGAEFFLIKREQREEFESYEIFPDEWRTVEISSCFRG